MKVLFTIAIRASMLVLFVFVGSVLPTMADAKPKMLDAKIGQQDGVTRVLLTFSEKAEFRLFALADPHRIVVDLDDTSIGLSGANVYTGQGHVTSMRFGLFKVGTSRVVFDLKGPVAVVQAVFLPKRGQQGQLLIDLAPSEEETFRKFALETNHLRPETREKTQEKTKDAVILDKQKKPNKNKTDKIVIVIDPGHGGVDPGTVSNMIYEKYITLRVAKSLAKELQATGRYKVSLTRENDVYIPLRERFRIARAKGADLFLSLHADSHANPLTRGASVYTLSDKASDAEAEALAHKENTSDIIAGVDLADKDPVVTNILIDLARRETNNLSIKFAQMVALSLRKDVPLLPMPQRSAGFAVLKAPDIPSALLEMGYLSNKKDLSLLRTEAHRVKLAKALRRAIDAYFRDQKWERDPK